MHRPPAGAASGAPNTPIRSESAAARAVVVAFLQRSQLRTMMQPFNHEPRNIIDRALRSVRAVTTLQDLAASPDGVVIDCVRRWSRTRERSISRTSTTAARS